MQLALHVRHLAWLSAKPGKGKDRRTRRAILAEKEDDQALALPFVEPGLTHLIGHLFDVGPSEGGEVLTYQEIGAWMALTGQQLTGWEVSTLRSLSSTYLGEADAATAPDCPPPFVPTTVAPIDRVNISNARLEMFMRLQAQHEGREFTPEAAPAEPSRQAPRRRSPRSA